VEKIEKISQELGCKDSTGLDNQVKEVKDEFEKLQALLKDKEKVRSLPLALKI